MKISLLLSTFNHAEYLQGCLTKIDEQTYKNYEVLVYNDGSTDNTKKILEEIKNRNQRYKIFSSNKNQGIKKAINFLIKKITGDLIFGIASDDFLVSKTFFQKTVAIMNDNPLLAGVFAKTEIRSPNLKKKLWVMGNCGVKGVLVPEMAVKGFFNNDLFVPGSSSIWRTKCFFDAGGFDHRLGSQCDYFINHVLPMKYGAYFLDETVAVMRKSGKSLSSAVKNQSFFKNHALFEKKATAFLGIQRPSNQQWKTWRKSVINARLDLELNGYLSKRLEEAFIRIHEWEKDALAPYLGEIKAIYETKAKPFNRWLHQEEQKAHRIFDKIAGRIENPTGEPCDTGLSSSGKKLRDYLKKITTLLK